MEYPVGVLALKFLSLLIERAQQPRANLSTSLIVLCYVVVPNAIWVRGGDSAEWRSWQPTRLDQASRGRRRRGSVRSPWRGACPRKDICGADQKRGTPV